jgi:hypothetical protein
MKISPILLLATAGAGAVLWAGGTAIAAFAPNYASLSKSLYGDEVCSTILRSLDLKSGLAEGASRAVSGVRPRNTSCVLLQSFVRMPGANIVARETVAEQGGDIPTPSAFASSKLPGIQLAKGERPATVRLALGASTSSPEILKTEEGKWRILFGGEMYDLDWEPIQLKMNPVTQTPYAIGANGKLWTTTFSASYQTWDAKGEAPVVRAIDSKGNLLVTSLVYDRLNDVWINKRYVGRYSEVDRDPSIPFSDDRADAVFYPGYVMTFADSLGFDKNDNLVIYRQEGRVFTRTAYSLK